MKNPLNSKNDRLDWWYVQAQQTLPQEITSVGIGTRTELRTDKHKRVGILTVSYEDLTDFTGTSAGRWILARLDVEPKPVRPSLVLHVLLSAAWVMLIINAITSVSDAASTALFLGIAGILSAGAHILYLRSALASSAQTVLAADRAATLDTGQEAARDWFGQRIDGIHRTPVHTFIADRSSVSLKNRARAVSLEVTLSGEVRAT